MGGEPPPGPKLVSDHRPRRAKPRPLLHHASVAEAVLDDTDSRRPFNVAVDCLAEVAAPAAAAELPIAQDVDADSRWSLRMSRIASSSISRSVSRGSLPS